MWRSERRRVFASVCAVVLALTRVRVCGAGAWFDAGGGLAGDGWAWRSAPWSMRRVGGWLGLHVVAACLSAMRAVVLGGGLAVSC